jgi:hypothetical protein
MTREAVEARKQLAKSIARKNPQLTIDEIRARACCSQETVRLVKKELAQEAQHAGVREDKVAAQAVVSGKEGSR